MVAVTQIVKKRKEKKKEKKKRKTERRKKNTATYSTRESCARLRSRHCPANENEWATGTT